MLIKAQIVIGTLRMVLILRPFEMIREEKICEKYSIFRILTEGANLALDLAPEFFFCIPYPIVYLKRRDFSVLRATKNQSYGS